MVKIKGTGRYSVCLCPFLVFFCSACPNLYNSDKLVFFADKAQNDRFIADLLFFCAKSFSRKSVAVRQQQLQWGRHFLGLHHTIEIL
jgi:hypothetical protein